MVQKLKNYHFRFYINPQSQKLKQSLEKDSRQLARLNVD